MKYQKNKIVWGILLLSLIVLSGCGSSPGADKKKGAVEITVTYGGEPVSEGSVQISIAEEGKGAGGSLNTNGKVTLSDVEIGSYTVCISPPSRDPEAAPETEPKKYKNIPKKFRTQATSPLKAEIKEGEKTSYTFDLKE